MLKKVGLLVVLLMALPLAAFADNQIDFTNSGGTLTGSNSGLSLSNSVLIAVNGLNGGGLVAGTNLGSFSFSTGALTSGSLQMGGTFAAGGTVSIVGNGINGVTLGTIFTGSFSSPVTWSMILAANGTHNYILTGAISGTFSNGATVNGAMAQLTINTKGLYNGKTSISSGDTNLSSVTPEPGTLVLFGTGLLGLAGALKKKIQS
jgi:PEP-CTERM motif-containing protein